MFLIEKLGRGRIPLHRSVRYVRFSRWRCAAWVLVALVATAVQLYFIRELIQTYSAALETLLTRAGVPFEAGLGDRLGFIAIPSWSVTTFNPVAVFPGAVAYVCVGLILTLAVWTAPKAPFPLRAWLSLLGSLLLLTTIVLIWRPVPRFTPELFSGLWLKVAVATSLAYPWIWALLVGVLPLPVTRVAAWGAAAWFTFVAWNVTRLAFCLALARVAGVLWLPIVFIFFCTLLDCFVFIIAFTRVLEPAGREWEEPA